MKSPVWAVLLLLAASPAAGGEDRAGHFDHYVLALSWSPSWCRAEGEARGADQCDPDHDHGFVLHGLWPQHRRGWPEYCRTQAGDPSRAETVAERDLFGSAGAAWHQWKKHGRCSGLGPGAYFDLARSAFDAVARPAFLGRLDEATRVEPDALEAAFLAANPALDADEIIVTCREGLIREVRICLDKRLVPRRCTAEVLDDTCAAHNAVLPPVH